MPSILPGTPTLIRNMNRLTVLEIIEKKGAISRAEIHRQSKISLPTVSSAVRHLLKKGIVKEKGLGRSSGGKRPILIELNPNGAFTMGIDLGRSGARMALVNPTGKIVKETEGPSIGWNPENRLLDRLKRPIHNLIDEANTDLHPVLAIGIALPGIPDASGRLSFASGPGWEHVPIKHLLTKEFGIPVAVENDVNAAVLGEKLFGIGATVQHFVLVSIGTGVGAGIVINGELYKGFADGAGEIGYLLVGDRCIRDYRKGGCFENLISIPAIAATATRRMGSRNNAFTETGAPGCTNIKTGDVFEAARREDPVALEIVEEMIRYLAIGLGNIAVLLNPEMIVLGGEIVKYKDLLLEPLKGMIARIAPIPPKIAVSSLGNEAGVMGASAMAWHLAKHTTLMS